MRRATILCLFCAAVLSRAQSPDSVLSGAAADAVPDAAAESAADDPAGEPIIETPRPSISAPQPEQRIHWTSLLEHEFLFLSFEHSFRVLSQEKTRDGVGGPFFQNWFYIASHVQWNHWSDGDKWFTANLAHPSQGDVVAWIYRYNDDSAARLELDLHDPRYRRMLLRSWIAAQIYSVQWKLGPLSEATIGHVGLHADQSSGTNRTGWDDYILDSFAGIPLMIGEDAVDKYATKKLEGRIHSRPAIATVRVALDPCRGIANIMMFKKPWFRDTRE